CPNHFDLSKLSESYCKDVLSVLKKYGLVLVALSNHLIGQAVCDNIDLRHKAVLPDYIWGDGDAEGVHRRASEELIKTAEAAKMMGVSTVVGFTGSSIWHLIYSFPPVTDEMIDAGYADFARRFTPILDRYKQLGVRFALEVHPTEIAFDSVSAERALKAVNNHSAFGFNFDPSHFGYQSVDYIGFIHQFADRIFHVHIKDVWWSDRPTQAGVFGGHTNFGDRRRYWDFRSVGRGKIDFDAITRALNRIGYQGALSVEWEDNGMDRETGATESCAFVRKNNFQPSNIAFDAAFEQKPS
ncbi:MAG: sugar phosphate isomerase/epimerase family protein, partial [Rikenellaceae bacterium]